jgi:hypothetical protein
VPCSAALSKFSERLKEVELLLSLCSTPESPAEDQKAAAPKDNAVLRAVLVLLCSHIEGFFEDLIGEALFAYGKIANDIDRIPREIISHQVIGRPERWNNCDMIKRWQIFDECVRHPLIKKDKEKIPSSIDPELHTKGFANPGTGEIDSLFKTIGFSDVWDKFSKIESNRIIKTCVDAIVHRRNQIAHGQMDSTVTRTDVERYMENVRRLAEVMDCLVEQEICTRLELDDAWALAQ